MAEAKVEQKAAGATVVAKKEAAVPAVQVPQELQGSWGSEGISNSDIIIPRLLLMQGLSEIVNDGGAAAGDIVRSTTKKILAKKGESVDFIPLMSFKSWIVSEKVADKFEYRREEPMNAGNENLPWTYHAKNDKGVETEWRRDQSINIYTLLVDDIARAGKAMEALAKGEMPSPEDALMPCLLSFRRSSYRTGRQMLTFFKSCEQFKTPPASGIYKLSSAIEKGEKGTYHVFQAEQKGRSTVEQLTVAKDWWKILNTAKIAIDADHIESDAGAPVTVVEGQKENF